MNLSTVTLGSDPEVFLQDATGIVSSQSARVPGDKDVPHVLEVGAVHRDNVLMELNVPPAKSAEEWVSNHTSCLQYAMSELSDNYNISQLASTYMSNAELWHPEAKIFGCSPDYNAWEAGRSNPTPKDKKGFRTAGGHIHVGWEAPTLDEQLALVKLMDLYLGIPALFMDKDTERRSLYGKAGCFRPKPYGVEYRSLSNFWMMDERLMRWAYDNTLRAVKALGHQSVAELEGLETIINMGDMSWAEQVVHTFDLEVL